MIMSIEPEFFTKQAVLNIISPEILFDHTFKIKIILL